MKWLDELARDALGNVRRRDVLAHATRDQADGMVAAGLLIPEFRGVYRVAGAPRSWPQRVRAACMAAGDGSFPSHGSAARIRGMRYVPAVGLEITAPGRVRLPGVHAHSSSLVLPAHLEVHPRVNWPVSSAARAACELSARLSLETLKKVVDTARRDKLLTYDEVWSVREDLRAKGRRRTTVLDAILATRVPGLEGDESEGEDRLLGWLVAGGLPTPVQQHWVVVNDMRYRCDLAYPGQRSDVEWDAFSTHGEDRESFDYDRLRDDDFHASGWDVVRVTEAWTPQRAVAAVSRVLRSAA